MAKGTMETRFIAFMALVLALSSRSAEGTVQNYAKVVKSVMPSTPAVYKVVDPTPEVLQYQVVSPATQLKVEEVRKVVSGPNSGCSIAACSQVTDGCGWCAKDGGYAVGYEKQVEVLTDKKRTTLTLKKECKGVFVFDASKCPSATVAPKATASATVMPKATAPAVHPTPGPTAQVAHAVPAAAETESVMIVEEPAETPVEIVTAIPVHASHGHHAAGHHHHAAGHVGAGERYVSMD